MTVLSKIEAQEGLLMATAHSNQLSGSRRRFFCAFVIYALLGPTITFAEGPGKFVPPASWTIESLTGKAPSYPGPSCYTAALLAMGYIDAVSYVGVQEIRFFLNNFCQLRTGPARAGDLLTLAAQGSQLNPPHLDHVAAIWETEKYLKRRAVPARTSRSIPMSAPISRSIR